MTMRQGVLRPDHPGGPDAGTTLVEVLVAVGIVATLAGVSVPALTTGRNYFRARAAAHYLASFVQEARSRAVHAGTHVAIRFRTWDGVIVHVAYIDGNRNGVRTADITAGVDRALSPEHCVTRDFPGVEFGAWAGTPDMDTGAPLPDNGLRLGASGLLSFGPDGTATSGTLYLKGRGGYQYAVRVLGATGRARVLRFDPASGRWDVP